jgi:hypothetical protein
MTDIYSNSRFHFDLRLYLSNTIINLLDPTRLSYRECLLTSSPDPLSLKRRGGGEERGADAPLRHSQLSKLSPKKERVKERRSLS